MTNRETSVQALTRAVRRVAASRAEAPAPRSGSRPEMTRVLASRYAGKVGGMVALHPRVTEMSCEGPEAVRAAGFRAVGGGQFLSAAWPQTRAASTGAAHSRAAHHLWELRPEDEGWRLVRLHEERLPDFRTAGRRTAQMLDDGFDDGFDDAGFETSRSWDSEDCAAAEDIIREGLSKAYSPDQIWDLLCSMMGEGGLDESACRACVMEAALRVGAEANGVFEVARKSAPPEAEAPEPTPEESEDAPASESDEDVAKEAAWRVLRSGRRLASVEKRAWRDKLDRSVALSAVRRAIHAGTDRYGKPSSVAHARLARAIQARTGLDLTGHPAVKALARELSGTRASAASPRTAQQGLLVGPSGGGGGGSSFSFEQDADLDPEDAPDFADAHDVMHGAEPETSFGEHVERHAQWQDQATQHYQQQAPNTAPAHNFDTTPVNVLAEGNHAAVAQVPSGEFVLYSVGAQNPDDAAIERFRDQQSAMQAFQELEQHMGGHSAEAEKARDREWAEALKQPSQREVKQMEWERAVGTPGRAPRRGGSHDPFV